ncbi:MAG: phage tail sheath subtilisin-like domain-containing protein [Deltaproteobacteria bacterium]
MTFATPGVYLVQEDRERTGLTAVRTDVTAFVGVAERGPVDTPTVVTSWEQFTSTFGGFVDYAYLPHAARAFFENGGRRLYVVRVASGSSRVAYAEVLDDAGLPCAEVVARSPGAWGNHVEVRIGTATGGEVEAIDHPLSTHQTLVVASVANLRVGARVRILQPETPSCVRWEGHRFVEAVDAIRRIVRLSSPLPAGVNLSCPIQVEDRHHFVTVYERGQQVEHHSPVHVDGGLGDPTSPAGDVHFFSSLRSSRVAVRQLTTSTPTDGTVRLSQGVDGLADLGIDSFVGSRGPGPESGLETLERVDEIAIVAVPDVHARGPRRPERAPPPHTPDPCLPSDDTQAAHVPPLAGAPDVPPGFSTADVVEIQRRLVEHCDGLGDRVAIIAPVAASTSMDVLDWRGQFDSSRAALYYPWISVAEADGSGTLRSVPPDGHVAGAIAASDLRSGVHTPPANLRLSWLEGLAEAIGDADQAVLNPAGINALRAFSSRGVRIFGARTASSDPAWRYLNVRRLMMMIGELLEHALVWAVYEPHDFVLREKVKLTVSTLLGALWSAGALVGETAEQAFFVRCDDSTNPPDRVALGELHARIGVAPVRPAEFIELRIGRVEQVLQVQEVRMWR